jgi:hypothetical protein
MVLRHIETGQHTVHIEVGQGTGSYSHAFALYGVRRQGDARKIRAARLNATGPAPTPVMANPSSPLALYIVAFWAGVVALLLSGVSRRSRCRCS